MNRSSPLLCACCCATLIVALVAVPLPARAQMAGDGGETSDAAVATDAGALADSGFPVTLPSPDAAVLGNGCDGQMINAPCMLAGAAGFCFPNGVDGSDEDLECVVDSDVDPNDGCSVATSASSAGSIGGISALLGFAAVGLIGGLRAGRRRRGSGSR